MIDVVFIAGMGRSGTTLLANILGEVPGFFSCGELNNIFNRGYRNDWPCGCGTTFSRCSVWREVSARAFGDVGRVDAQTMNRLMRRGATLRYIPLMMMPGGRRVLNRRMGLYPEAVGKLYRAIHSITGGQALVDSSKTPAYGFVLQGIPDVRMRVIHLVRDPRAVAYSQTTPVLTLPHLDQQRLQYVQTVFQSAAKWLVYHTAIESFWKRSSVPYYRVNYETFARHPCRVFHEIRAFLGVAAGPAAFIDETTVKLGPNHNFSGNRSRFLRGNIPITCDTRWQSELTPLKRQFVTAMTYPLLKKYGYPIAVPDGGA